MIALIYHSADLDGLGSAAVYSYWARHYSPKDEVSFIGWTYGDPLPDFYIFDQVIACDISFPLQVMVDLVMNHPDFVWIDHHQQPIDEVYAALEETGITHIEGIQNSTTSACEHVWEYFFGDKYNINHIIEYLALYDSFNHRGRYNAQEILNFQYGARQRYSEYTDIVEDLESERDSYEIIQEVSIVGAGIYGYMCKEAESKWKNRIEVKYDGMKFAAVNATRLNVSNFGIDYNKEGYDALISFSVYPDKIAASIYTERDDLDVSAIAKSFGGGGHKKASGFMFMKDRHIVTTNMFTNIIEMVCDHGGKIDKLLYND